MNEMTAIFSIICVIVVFVVGTIAPINLGVISFAAAMVIGIVCGIPSATILAGFPVSTVMTLMGLCYMLQIASMNGTIKLMANGLLKLVRGRYKLLPWIFFLIAFIITALGTTQSAVVLTLAPACMTLAKQTKASPFMMGLMTAMGAVSGAYTPLGHFMVTVRGALQPYGLDGLWSTIFLNSFFFCFLIALVLYLALGGLKIKSSSGSSEDLKLIGVPEKLTATAEQAATLAAFVILIVGGLVLGYDLGLMGFVLGLLLTLFNPKRDAEVIKTMPWNIIVVLAGIMTMVNAMDTAGGTDLIVSTIATSLPPAIAPLVLIAVAAISSFYGTTGPLMGTLTPMAVELMNTLGNANVAGMVIAVCIAGLVVDVNPIGITGIGLVSNYPYEDKDRFFAKLMKYGVAMILVGSVCTWLLFVVLGFHL